MPKGDWALPAEVRFWAKVNKDGPMCEELGTECWLWTAHTNGGYGYFRFEGSMVKVHRWVYEQYIGPIPEGLEIDHLCRVKNCVRPEHLEAVTHLVNVQRGLGWRTRYPLQHTEATKVRYAEQAAKRTRRKDGTFT